jgi:signal peptidase I
MRKQPAVWLLLLLLLAAPAVVGLVTGGTAGFAYVISGSMEPTLHIGDGFLLWPARRYQPGDVITYRPVVLKAERVTHRIRSESPGGFVTLGDANAGTDQADGEPPVTPDRIIGRAVTLGGQVVRIPQLGEISGAVRGLFGSHLTALAGAMLGLGLLLVVADALRPGRQRRSRARWRVGHLYAALSGTLVLAVGATMLLGSRVHPVEYLASQNPGSQTNHVPVGRDGTVKAIVHNLGVIPVYHFSTALGQAEVLTAPTAIAARSEGEITLRTPPRATPGWYREYVRVFHYPPVLPRPLLVRLYAQSPYLAMFGVLAALGMMLWIGSWFLNTWAPLNGQRDSAPIWLRRLFRTPSNRRRAS